MNNDASQELNREQIALGVRQPWAELLLRGTKSIEVRSRPTNVRGPIYIYTSKVFATEEFASDAIAKHEVDIQDCVRGMLIGSIEIEDCRLCVKEDAAFSCVPWEIMNGKYAWTMRNPKRFAEPVSVRFLPYGIWFYPFKRRNQSR